MKTEIRECLICNTSYSADSEDSYKRKCPNCDRSQTYTLSTDDAHDDTNKDIADRFNAGKPQWSMVDFKSLEDMVRVLEFGANKYSRNNWKKGLKTTEVVDSMLRHIYAYLEGEDVYPESGINHTEHIMCNAMFLSHMHLFRKDMDTRCKTLSKE